MKMTTKMIAAILSLIMMIIMMIGAVAGVQMNAYAAEAYGRQESVTYSNASSLRGGNRVYFYNMSGGKATLSDFVIVESNGHWGLIDSGHRKSDVITDGKNQYTVSQDRGLSSQVNGKSGVDAAKYMVETLGVKHLDFIIGTHAHSDHVGGIPEIAKLRVTDAKTRKTGYLVDSNTVYIYKPYNAVNTTNDDLRGASSQSWHNQAYAYQAQEAMKQRGAVLVDLSCGAFINNANPAKLNFAQLTNKLNGRGAISNAAFIRGGNRYGDCVRFRFGNMEMTLYNLYMHKTNIDENVNSIVTTITCNGNKVASMADINVEDCAEQQIAKAIRNNIGTVHVMKAPHHGVCRGSNSKELYDLLRPQKVLATRNVSNVSAEQAAGAYANAMKYAKAAFNSTFYEVGASNYGLVVDMNGRGAPVYNLTGRGKAAKLVSSEPCVSRMRYANGWSSWDKKWSWNNGKVTDREIYYFNNNRYDTGWRKWNGRWFYMNSNGVMSTGWEKIDGKWYYFNTEETSSDFGAMETGWQKVGGKWYYLNADGAMRTGWFKDKGKWYYLNYDGSMAVYTNTIGGKTYYFNGAGAMVTGWLKFNNGKWRYFNSSGAMETGVLNQGGKRYLLCYSDGYMITGWYTNSRGTYYYRPDGSMAVGNCVPETDYYTRRANTAGKVYRFSKEGILRK